MTLAVHPDVTVLVGRGGNVGLSPDGHGESNAGHAQGGEDTVVDTVVIGNAQLDDAFGVGVGSPTAMGVGKPEAIMGPPGSMAMVKAAPREYSSEGYALAGGADWMGPPGLVLMSAVAPVGAWEAQVAQKPQMGGLPTSTDAVQSSGEASVVVVGPGVVGPVGSPGEHMEVGSRQAIRQTICGLVKVAVMVGVAQDEISGTRGRVTADVS